MMSVTISVIIPTRFRNHLLPRAVRSVLGQSFQDFEILVVDDNPPTHRVSIDPVLASLLQHPKVRVLVHDQPRNASAARNVGLHAASGQWITYLDDDDAYQPAKLEKQLKQSEKSALPLGVCGTTVHLMGRTRKHVFSQEKISRGELLLLSFVTPTLFHRNTKAVFFDENLFAGEDGYFFHQLVRHFGIDHIFNVPESLIDAYPQAGWRVNANAAGLWQACQAIHSDFARSYTPLTADVFITRSELGYLKYQAGGLNQMMKIAWKLWRLRGRHELRFIVNAFLFKLPLIRRLLVS
jgi:glycosyltransferase involved in cell wall biosynthesis